MTSIDPRLEMLERECRVRGRIAYDDARQLRERLQELIRRAENAVATLDQLFHRTGGDEHAITTGQTSLETDFAFEAWGHVDGAFRDLKRVEQKFGSSYSGYKVAAGCWARLADGE